MVYKFSINKTARNDMKKILDYRIKIFSSYILVDKLLDDIKDKISLIKYNPYMYQKLENYLYKGKVCQRMVIGKYSVIYCVQKEEHKITILHIVPNKSNFFNSKKFK